MKNLMKKKFKKFRKKLYPNLSKNEIIERAFKYHLEGNIAEASKYYQFLLIKVLKIIEFF